MKRLKLLPLAAIALIGCLDGTGPRRPGGPNALISDGAHGTGHRFFFFLPPMVPNPTPTGTFDRFRSPAVEICQLAGDENSSCATTIATFTMTSGVGSVVRVVPADKHYIVNWHTNLFPSLLSAPTIYRIQVFDQESAPGELLGFADVQLADNGKEAKSLTSEQMIGLVDGRTLPIKFRIEFGAVDLCPLTDEPCARATVGPEGGQLVATDDAGVALAFADFPAGWTDTPREVTISQIVSGCDGECGPGEGPLEGAPAGVRQYPLFFQYSTVPPSTPEEPFNLPVRIGVCNVGGEFGDAFHPPHRGTTALALGAEPEGHGFVILDFAPTGDLLGGCVDVAPFPGGGGGDFGLNRLDGWQGLLARAGMLAANVLAPRALEAMVLVDGGMGGSTEFFSPVGTVDTASGDLGAPALLSPLREPLIIQNNPEIGCTLSAEPTRGYGHQIVFDWTDVAGATAYEIFAEHEGAVRPIVNTTVEGSSYTLTSCNSFVEDGNLTGWHWRVRAIGSGETAGPWSEFANFAFEPCRLPDESVCRVP